MRFYSPFIYILLLFSSSFIHSQVIPDFEMTFKVVDPLGTDSVTIGLSTNAGEGFDEGYDVIDTSALQLPVDLRIFDPAAIEQLGDSCKHFSTSYLDFPNEDTYNIEKFEREFTLVLRIDLEQINNGAEGTFCNDEEVLEGTYLQFDLSQMFEYKFRNNIGFDFDLIEINPSGNIFLAATDGYYYNVWITPEEYCLNILAYNSRAFSECNVDIFFNVALKIKNKLFVGIDEATKTPQITANNNAIFIENAFPFKNYTLFDVNGSLLKQQAILTNNTTIDINQLQHKILIIRLGDPLNSHFLIHKILNL